jgi:hypothetical protein
LYRVGVDAARLAADPATMQLMVRATRQAFTALRPVRRTRGEIVPVAYRSVLPSGES